MTVSPPPSTSPPPPAGPGNTTLIDEVGRTKESFSRLLNAHIALFKAELNDILNQLKVMASLAGVALAVALMVGAMVYVGGFLFLGEWLFGSIGWGLAHGVLFGLGLIVALALGIMGAPGRSHVLSLLLAIFVMALIAFILGLNIASNAVANLASTLAPPLNSVGLIAALAGAVVFGVLLMVVGMFVGRARGAIFGLIGGAILGLLFGWLIAGAPWTWPPAVGFAITIGLLLWPIFNFAVAWPQINLEERFGSLAPRQSMEAINETRSWLEEQWQTRLPMRGKK